MMGGLVNSQMVKGDLWMVEVGNGSMNCYPVNTTSEGPGPRVGHASLLVGNAFIVFGGDTKLEDGDLLDDTLYLLNTGMFSKPAVWHQANPQQRPNNGQEPRRLDQDQLVVTDIRSTFLDPRFTYLVVKSKDTSSTTSSHSILTHYRLQVISGRL
jgi:hypothetical protein